MNSSTITRYKFYMTHNMEVFQKKIFFRIHENTEIPKIPMFFLFPIIFFVYLRETTNTVCANQ